MSRWAKCALLVAVGALSACAPSDDPDGVQQDSGGQDAGVDSSDPTDGPPADKYEFCDWRTLKRTDDLAADMVGEWIVLRYSIDYGQHAYMRLDADGTYVQRYIGTGCEEEPMCFASGPASLCGLAETTGDWRVDGDVLKLDDGHEFLYDPDGSDGEVIRFAAACDDRYFRPATCETCR